MPGPLLIRNRQCQVLQIPGIPPGLFVQVSYDEFSLWLQPGDTLLFCRDGLTDARSSDDVEFGLEGLRQVCNNHCTASPLDLLEQVFTELEIFTRDCRQFDDMTAAVFHHSART